MHGSGSGSGSADLSGSGSGSVTSRIRQIRGGSKNCRKSFKMYEKNGQKPKYFFRLISVSFINMQTVVKSKPNKKRPFYFSCMTPLYYRKICLGSGSGSGSGSADLAGSVVDPDPRIQAWIRTPLLSRGSPGGQKYLPLPPSLCYTSSNLGKNLVLAPTEWQGRSFPNMKN